MSDSTTLEAGLGRTEGAGDPGKAIRVDINLHLRDITQNNANIKTLSEIYPDLDITVLRSNSGLSAHEPLTPTEKELAAAINNALMPERLKLGTPERAALEKHYLFGEIEKEKKEKEKKEGAKKAAANASPHHARRRSPGQLPVAEASAETTGKEAQLLGVAKDLGLSPHVEPNGYWRGADFAGLRVDEHTGQLFTTMSKVDGLGAQIDIAFKHGLNVVGWEYATSPAADGKYWLKSYEPLCTDRNNPHRVNQFGTARRAKNGGPLYPVTIAHSAVVSDQHTGERGIAVFGRIPPGPLDEKALERNRAKEIWSENEWGEQAWDKRGESYQAYLTHDFLSKQVGLEHPTSSREPQITAPERKEKFLGLELKPHRYRRAEWAVAKTLMAAGVIIGGAKLGHDIYTAATADPRPVSGGVPGVTMIETMYALAKGETPAEQKAIADAATRIMERVNKIELERANKKEVAANNIEDLRGMYKITIEELREIAPHNKGAAFLSALAAGKIGGVREIHREIYGDKAPILVGHDHSRTQTYQASGKTNFTQPPTEYVDYNDSTAAKKSGEEIALSALSDLLIEMLADEARGEDIRNKTKTGWSSRRGTIVKLIPAISKNLTTPSEKPTPDDMLKKVHAVEEARNAEKRGRKH